MQLSPSTASAKTYLITLIFTIKALISIPALFACSVCPGHLQEDKKKLGTQLIFPQRVSKAGVRVSAAPRHATALAGRV